MKRILVLSLVLFSCKQESANRASLELYQGNETFTVIFGGDNVGYLKTNISGDTIYIDYDYKSNGRGPTIKEELVLNKKGFPTNWNITGNSTFGNAIDEHYNYNGSVAVWTDATGTYSREEKHPVWYINQSGSSYDIILLFRNLIRAKDHSLPVLPGGTAKLTEMEKVSIPAGDTLTSVTTYALSGIGTFPTYFAVDDNQRLVAFMSAEFAIVREGFEKEEKNLRKLAENYSDKHLENLQKQYAHRYEKNVRIVNVRVFDPLTLSLSGLSSVVVEGERIKSVDATETRGENEIIINGEGGTLIAGMYEMHAHTDDAGAMFNVLAGITSFRDMGSDNEVLTGLIEKINSGKLAGPRIHRLGFIEGKSPYNANLGIIVSSEEEALAAVDTYHKMGFYGVKLYNSMDGKWAPAIVKKAHKLGMFVCGHVPAFSNANAMLNAGFNEMTHINQTMLGWVLTPDEDTRTLLRLTALKRLPDVDINSGKVQETLNLFLKYKTGIDPTLGIHEALLLSRNGEIWPGAADFIDHMPPNVQREYKRAMANIETPEDDLAYRQAYDKIIETLKMMKEKGILIVPGTDLGGSFLYHRELELYQQLGFTPAELVKLATYDMAQYMGDADLGSIAAGKIADFFLVPGNPVEDIKAIKKIKLVSRGGTFYYPAEVYPVFGIKPFASMPEVID